MRASDQAMRTVTLLVLASLPGVVAQEPADRDKDRKRAVVAAYAALAHGVYADTLERAEAMREAVDAFVAEPSVVRLRAARAAWSRARRAYGPTEVFRFYGGPIDGARTGVERYVNAWPIDESFIDGVRGRPEAGIIQAPERYPVLSGALLTLLNERGGETHVATGWHAVEFLLWGQDFDPAGPGKRSHLDFVAGARPHAARRGAYLRAVVAQLVVHLAQVRDDWAPGKPNYHAGFVAGDPDGALRKILTGMVVLSGFEMSGERLAVAFETRDQEDEHSCFSDTTHLDLLDNQRGVERVWSGETAPRRPGLREVGRAVAPELALDIDRALATTRTRLQAIPPPFDRAMQGADESPGRRAILSAIEALERQARLLAELGLALELRVPLRPGN